MRNKILNVDKIELNYYYKNNKVMFLALIKLINENNTQYASMLSGKRNAKTHTNTKYKALFNWINQQVKVLDNPFYSIKTKCYWIINNIISFNDYKVCCHNNKCKKPFVNKNVINIFDGYSSRGHSYAYCCKKCSANTQLTKDNRKKTCIKKYNVEYTFQSENNKQKTRHTINKKYNANYFVETQQFKEKSKITKAKRHNDCFYNNRNKFKKTCIKKFGVTHYMKNKDVAYKIRQSYFKKTGYYYPAQNPNSPKYARYIYNNIKFMLKPEVAYYIWLKDNQYKFEYQPKSKIIMYDTTKFDKKHHMYFPDFYIISDKNGNIINELHEIKGNNQFRNNNVNDVMIDINDAKLNYKAEAKHQCMLKNNVKIITFNQYKIYLDYVSHKYGKKFLDNCKIPIKV